MVRSLLGHKFQINFNSVSLEHLHSKLRFKYDRIGTENSFSSKKFTGHALINCLLSGHARAAFQRTSENDFNQHYCRDFGRFFCQLRAANTISAKGLAKSTASANRPEHALMSDGVM
jgi:hypothetical protein